MWRPWMWWALGPVSLASVVGAVVWIVVATADPQPSSRVVAGSSDWQEDPLTDSDGDGVPDLAERGWYVGEWSYDMHPKYRAWLEREQSRLEGRLRDMVRCMLEAGGGPGSC